MNDKNYSEVFGPQSKSATPLLDRLFEDKNYGQLELLQEWYNSISNSDSRISLSIHNVIIRMVERRSEFFENY